MTRASAFLAEMSLARSAVVSLQKSKQRLHEQNFSLPMCLRRGSRRSRQPPPDLRLNTFGPLMRPAVAMRRVLRLLCSIGHILLILTFALFANFAFTYNI